MPFTYEYPRPSVTVDCVIFGFDPSAMDGALRVLLIQRKDDPFSGYWALPGGFVNANEPIAHAAARELQEETGITGAYLEQLYTFGDPGRDPRGHVISVAHMALVRPRDHQVEAGSDAAAARWFSATEAVLSLAFDHHLIVRKALERLRGKVRYTPVGFHLLPKKFTIGQLRWLYSALLQRDLDSPNFRKKVEKDLVRPGVLIATGETQKGTGRPAPLYRFEKRAYERALRDESFHFEI